MKKILAIIFFSFLSLITYSQKVYDSSVIVITVRESCPQTEDSCCFTNRFRANEALAFFGKKIDNDKGKCAELSEQELHNWFQKPGDQLVFVHGDAKSFNQAYYRGRMIAQMYRIDVIVFSWPTKDDSISFVKNFGVSKENARKGTEYLKAFFRFLADYQSKFPDSSADRKISLMFHSLGNYYLSETISREGLEDIHGLHFDNIILNSAASPSHNHAVWVEQINMQERLYITGNRHDFNLQGARFAHGAGYQLGQRFLKPYASNALYLDFSPSVGLRYYPWSSHSYFFGRATDERRYIYQMYYSLFHGEAVDVSDCSQFKEIEKNKLYKVLKQ